MVSLLPPPTTDQRALPSYRLQRLQQQLAAADCAAALLFDPINREDQVLITDSGCELPSRFPFEAALLR
jgi:hypothetical protein